MRTKVVCFFSYYFLYLSTIQITFFHQWTPYYSPGPALTTGRRGYFWGDPRSFPGRGPVSPHQFERGPIGGTGAARGRGRGREPQQNTPRPRPFSGAGRGIGSGARNERCQQSIKIDSNGHLTPLESKLTIPYLSVFDQTDPGIAEITISDQQLSRWALRMYQRWPSS